jgi:pilus assembly protein Flp/PilA
MLTRINRTLRREDGQGMTEYIIIVALIAIAAIGVITIFGENLRQLFGVSADAMVGNTNVATGRQTNLGTNKAKVKKGLNDFGTGNQGAN